MRKRLFLKATPAWLERVLLVLILSIAIVVLIRDPQDWRAMLAVIVLLFAFVPTLLCSSYLLIDYDKDFIETSLCKTFGQHNLRRYCGLKMASAIRIDMIADGAEKYLVFKNGDEIELPETKDIEHILSRWYEHYFHIQLPIQKNKYFLYAYGLRNSDKKMELKMRKNMRTKKATNNKKLGRLGRTK